MLKKVGKYYWLDIRIDGKRIRRSLRTDNRTHAIHKAERLRSQLLNERGSKDIRFDEFCKQYIEYAWNEKPKSALKEEQRLEKIKAFWTREFQIKRLSDITPYHIEQLKAALKAGKLSEGRSKDKDNKELSKATVNYYLQLLRGMFYKAIDWEIYSKQNPLKKVRFYKLNTRREVLSRSQINKVIEASREISQSPLSPLQKVFYDLVILAINTGMRKSEILNLRWKDINNNELSVRGKGDKIRSVPLNQEALRILGSQPRKNEYVFDIPNRNKHDLFSRTTRKIKKRSGLDFHFHLLRHYFATSLVEKNIDIVTISELLGHSKLSTTMIYSHTDKERKQRAVESLLK